MMLLTLIIHLMANVVLGAGILACWRKRVVDASFGVLSLLVGMLFETMIVGGLSAVGLPILAGFISTTFIGIALTTAAVKRGNISLEHIPLWSWQKPNLWEALLSLVLVERFLWVCANIGTWPLYFDTALTRGSGRAKAWVSGTNWSWESSSPHFLGKVFASPEQPFFATIWRGIGATLYGSHPSFLARVDGLILLAGISVIAYTWVYTYSRRKWLGLAVALLITSMPLELWHAVAGGGDLYIQAFILLALWLMTRGDDITAGIVSAGLIWGSQVGLTHWIPALSIIFLGMLLFHPSTSLKDRLLRFVRYQLSWMLVIAPWIIYKWTHDIPILKIDPAPWGYREGALTLLFNTFFNHASAGILWIGIFLGFACCWQQIRRDLSSSYAFWSALVLVLLVAYIYTCTAYHGSMTVPSTVHVTLLQIAPVCIISLATLLPLKDKEHGT